MNTFGRILKLTTFGESHGSAVGGVLDGFPAGVTIDPEFLAFCMARRKPGQSALTTQRSETDEVEIISGVFGNISTGAPLAFIIRNKDTRSVDYENLKNTYRPSHADYTYTQKYGLRDYRGGGRASARETACRVAAGAFAQMWLRQQDIQILAWVSQVGHVQMNPDFSDVNLRQIEGSPIRCPDPEAAEKMTELIHEVKASGDTIGGVISAEINGLPVGLGSPVYAKFHADLGAAMLSINAVKGFDYGAGFSGITGRGSELNDIPVNRDGKIRHLTNHSGGIQGGITNGEPVVFRVAFKPVATLSISQQTIDNDGNEIELNVSGRHDPCVLPRAVPVVEAMSALVTADHILMHRTVKA